VGSGSQHHRVACGIFCDEQVASEFCLSGEYWCLDVRFLCIIGFGHCPANGQLPIHQDGACRSDQFSTL